MYNVQKIYIKYINMQKGLIEVLCMFFRHEPFLHVFCIFYVYFIYFFCTLYILFLFYRDDVYGSINHTELTDLAGHTTHFGLQAIKQYYIPDTSLAAEEVGGII